MGNLPDQALSTKLPGDLPPISPLGMDSGQWSGRDLVSVEFTGRPAKLRAYIIYQATGFLRLRCKALKPTSDSRLQDFLGTLQSLKPTPLRYLARAISFFPKSLAYT